MDAANGERLPLAELCERLGRNYHTMFNRIFVRGMTVKDAVAKPVTQRRA